METIVTTREEMEMRALEIIAKDFPNPSVLHLGSKVIYAAGDSVRKLFPSASRFVGLDFMAGEGVDVVADIHKMNDAIGCAQFDVIWSDAVLEHIERPWQAAAEMALVLRPGGYCFHITHQTFPLHCYPQDFWRFSGDGLASLFSKAAGFEVLRKGHCWPIRLADSENAQRLPVYTPCFVHSMILAKVINPPDPRLVALRDLYN